MINKEKIIMLDIDNTVFPLVESILTEYNKKYNDSLLFEQIKSYDIESFTNSKCKNFFEEFMTKDLYLNNTPYENSVEILTKLNEIYTVMFCTASNVLTLEYRHYMLEKYFSFYNQNILNRARYKSKVVKCSVLVDDWEENLIGGDYIKILYSQPWNQSISIRRGRLIRMNDWNECSFSLIKDLL